MELTRELILKKLKENYPYLASEYGLKRLGLFGSHAKGTHAEENSDIDIVVEFQKPIGLKFVEFAEYLENILGRKTDVLTQAGVDGIRNPEITREIKKTIIYV